MKNCYHMFVSYFIEVISLMKCVLVFRLGSCIVCEGYLPGVPQADLVVEDRSERFAGRPGAFSGPRSYTHQ